MSKSRPRSPSERGKASRLRRLGSLTKGDAQWLRRYDAAVERYAEDRKRRADRRSALPKKVRARSNTERGKASRYRARLASGDGLTAKESSWLDRYEAAVTAAKRGRAARSAKKRKRGSRGDAIDLAQRLRDWLGGGDATPTVRRTNSGHHHAEVKVSHELAGYGGGRTIFDRPDLVGALSKGNAVTVRVLLDLPKGRQRWVSVLAYTDDAQLAEGDLYSALQDVEDAYSATGVAAVAVYVGAA